MFCIYVCALLYFITVQYRASRKLQRKDDNPLCIYEYHLSMPVQRDMTIAAIHTLRVCVYEHGLVEYCATSGYLSLQPGFLFVVGGPIQQPHKIMKTFNIDKKKTFFKGPTNLFLFHRLKFFN